jgi:hypothetical protein
LATEGLKFLLAQEAVVIGIGPLEQSLQGQPAWATRPTLLPRVVLSPASPQRALSARTSALRPWTLRTAEALAAALGPWALRTAEALAAATAERCAWATPAAALPLRRHPATLPHSAPGAGVAASLAVLTGPLLHLLKLLNLFVRQDLLQRSHGRHAQLPFLGQGLGKSVGRRFDRVERPVGHRILQGFMTVCHGFAGRLGVRP